VLGKYPRHDRNDSLDCRRIQSHRLRKTVRHSRKARLPPHNDIHRQRRSVWVVLPDNRLGQARNTPLPYKGVHEDTALYHHISSDILNIAYRRRLRSRSVHRLDTRAARKVYRQLAHNIPRLHHLEFCRPTHPRSPRLRRTVSRTLHRAGRRFPSRCTGPRQRNIRQAPEAIQDRYPRHDNMGFRQCPDTQSH
jgi:hypothetical protein